MKTWRLTAEFVLKNLKFQMISVDTENSMRLYNLCKSGKLKLPAIFVTLQAKEETN